MIDTTTKYGFDVSVEVITKNVNRLTNQVWKLIPMYENAEDWEKQLNTVIREIAGFSEVFNEDPQFLQLLAKLESIKVSSDFSVYRKTVFEGINLLQGLLK